MVTMLMERTADPGLQQPPAARSPTVPGASSMSDPRHEACLLRRCRLVVAAAVLHRSPHPSAPRRCLPLQPSALCRHTQSERCRASCSHICTVRERSVRHAHSRRLEAWPTPVSEGVRARRDDPARARARRPAAAPARDPPKTPPIATNPGVTRSGWEPSAQKLARITHLGRGESAQPRGR